eukprot:gene36801-44644_t
MKRKFLYSALRKCLYNNIIERIEFIKRTSYNNTVQPSSSSPDSVVVVNSSKSSESLSKSPSLGLEWRGLGVHTCCRARCLKCSLLYISFGLSEFNAVRFEDGAEYSVRCQGFASGCELVKGRLQEPNSHAYGTYINEIGKDGWGKLWVHADATDDGWYQAGFLEGALTAQGIYQHFTS